MSRTILNIEVGEYVVYPTHGIGILKAVEQHTISDEKVELLVIEFERDKMTLRVPAPKAEHCGLRPLSSPELMHEVMETLSIRTKPKRNNLWSRRAQEYATKINSGVPRSIAEVLRELYKSPSISDQSFSERQIYQTALERLVHELAMVHNIDERSAAQLIEKKLDAA
jgi:CarD family transcriptional regulator